MITHHQHTEMKPTRVVILGAGGFIARALGRDLAAAGIENRPVSSREIDLLQQDSAAKLRTIIRREDSLVITSAFTPEKGKDVGTFMKNLIMVQNLCRFFEESSCHHVVYLSSDAALDDQASLVRETTPRNPGSLYGLMHVAREQMLDFALDKPRVPLLIVRPCAVYGAGDTHNSYGPNRFMRTARTDGKITLFGNGEEQRDHIYIRDLSFFLVLGLSRRSAGSINLATGMAVSFYELAQKIAALSPSKVEIQCLPRNSPITHRHFDISLRFKSFPSFQTTSLDDGLSEMSAEMRPEQNP